MVRPNWNYIRVDNELPDDDKLDGLSPHDHQAVIGCLVIAWAFCDRQRTDGFINRARWSKTGTPGARRLVVSRGFAVPVDGGVQMHNYAGEDGHQRSRAEIEELSAKRKKAGAAGGHKKAENRSKALALASDPPLANATHTVLAEAEAGSSDNTATLPGAGRRAAPVERRPPASRAADRPPSAAEICSRCGGRHDTGDCPVRGPAPGHQRRTNATTVPARIVVPPEVAERGARAARAALGILPADDQAADDDPQPEFEW